MLKRTLQIAVVLTAAFSMLGASAPSSRFDKLGHKLMCTCGCAEILLECNHVGCPDSTHLIADLHTQVDSGASDSGVLTWFASTYGPVVLAAPLRGNFFDTLSWFVPYIALLAGIIGIFLLVRYWRRRIVPSTPVPHTPAGDALLDRIRKDTEY